MKYPASEKLVIIRLVENSHLGVKRTLEKIAERFRLVGIKASICCAHSLLQISRRKHLNQNRR